MPAMSPISMAPNGPMFMSAHVPTATPPAKVAFWMCTYTYQNKCMTQFLLLTSWSIAVVIIRGKLPDHVQFAFVLHQAGEGVGREHAGGQGEVGVDHCGELNEAASRLGDGWVKARPEHPQEDGSCRTGWEKRQLSSSMLHSCLCPLDGRSHTYTGGQCDAPGRGNYRQEHISSVNTW